VGNILPKRASDSHKGDNGRLLVVGGSERFVGAPALTALAALKSGVDLAVVAAPELTAWSINSFSPDLITVKLPGRQLMKGAIRVVLQEVKKFNCVVVGPGLGDERETRKVVSSLLQKLRRSPVVVDADALKALPRFKGFGKWILTPHGGEFSKITGKALPKRHEEKIEMTKEFAEKIGCTVLLKGSKDIIVSPDGRVAVNLTGNPGMTVGGTGDVLSGIVGSLVAQGVAEFEAACFGAWICGRAGDLCRREKGYEFTASEVIEKIPEVFKELRRLS